MNVREIECKSLLNESKLADYCINCYVGCEHCCKYCIPPESLILTKGGLIQISDFIDKYFDIGEYGIKNGEFGEVLAHNGKFKKTSAVMRHFYAGKMAKIKAGYFGELALTPNHKVFALKREDLLCHFNPSVVCYPNRKKIVSTHMKIIDCKKCNYRKNLAPSLIPAAELSKDYLLLVPIPKITEDMKFINSYKILSYYIQKITHKAGKNRMLPLGVIKKIKDLHKNKMSISKIARELNIDRASVSKYIKNEPSLSSPVFLVKNKGKIRFSCSKGNGIPELVKLDNNFLKLAGYYLSEGCVYKLKDRVTSRVTTFTFNQNEKKLIEETIRLIKNIFDIEPRITTIPENKAVHIIVHSAELGAFFEDLFGSKSCDKRIPESFLFLPTKKQSALITGLILGDGYMKNLGLCITSKTLARQYSIMLLRLGILHGLSITKKNRKSPAFYIRPQDNSFTLSKFANILKEIKFDLPKKKLLIMHGDINRDFAIVPIIENRFYNFSGFVYNLSVENDHSYTSNLFAVSNCYADSITKRFSQHANPWGKFVDVKINAPEVLGEEISKKAVGRVFISSLTDPYQPLEKKYRLMRKCLEILLKHQFPITIQTKSSLVLRDLDLIKQFKDSEVGFTVTSLDEETRRNFEPCSSPVEEKLEAIRILKENGIKVYVFFGPVLPHLSDRDLNGFFETMFRLGVDEVLVDRMNLKPGVWDSLSVVLKKNYPELVEKWREILFSKSDYYKELKEKIWKICEEKGIKCVFCY